MTGTADFRIGRKRSGLKTGASLLPLCGLALLWAAPAWALGSAGPLAAPTPAPVANVESLDVAAKAGEDIKEIAVEGAVRLERDTILSYLTVSTGGKASAEDINDSLKALFATGLFADVNLRLEDGVLTVAVTENPIVSSVTIEGNDAVNKDDIEKEIKLKARQVYTLPKVQKDVQRILDLYRRSGRFAATVEPKVVQQGQNRVDVIFEIAEGKRTGVRRIKFVGNDHYKENELRPVIDTQESAWWKFLSSADFYDPDRTLYDRELLRHFYLNEGYVDFRVVSSVAEMTPDRSDFFLTFTLDEGPRYRFGQIRIESEIKGLEGESLRENLFVKTGEWYSAEKVEKSIAKLTAVLGDKQYAFVDILPEPDKHKDTQIVDLVLRIKPGQRVHIGRIDVQGNTRTHDNVIRRELTVAEGDPYSTSKIKRSEQKIKDLGYFETVKVTPAPGAQPDRSDVTVEVKEKSTGEISMGAGFSSTDGPLGDFSVRERNFLGRGQDVRVGATISGVTRQFDFSFTEPYFLDRDLSAGTDIFHTRRDQQSTSNYDEVSTGFGLRLGYPLSEQLRQLVTYTLRNDKISNVDADASRFIKDQVGQRLTSMVGQELTYDARDSKLDPTEGFMTKLKTEAAGLGGDARYLRLRVTGQQYYTLADDYVLSALVEGGYVHGLDQKVRINDRFFLGGDTLRGFAYGGIGPRDMTGGADDSLGGDRYVRSSIEMTFPTPMPKDLGFKAHVFTDAATLSHSGETAKVGEDYRDDSTPRVTAGIGLSWASPFGPVRLDFAVPVAKQDYDKTESIHFSFGTRF